MTKEQDVSAIVKKAGLLLVASLFFLGAVAWAEEGNGGLFTWTDKDGVIHMTDNLDKVPEEYRSRTQRIGDGTSGGTVVPEAQRPAAPAASDRGGDDTALKAQWQSRMLDAKRRLAGAEDNYRQIEKRKNDLQSQWGSAGAALPTQDTLDEIKRLDADMARAKADVDTARDLVNNVIPDEARKAGIPPGWLREVE